MTGSIRWVLRLEALAVLVVAVAAYARGGHGWGVFAGLLLVPDLSLLGYLGGRRAGPTIYNVVHSYVGPIAVLAVSLIAVPGAQPYALIWLAHCAMDRTLGYGLKSTAGFRHTHLGMIGRDRAHAAAA